MIASAFAKFSYSYQYFRLNYIYWQIIFCYCSLMKLKSRTRKISALLILILALCQTGFAQAQDLEPRRWSHLPTGLNVIGVGLGSTSGDILLDPVVRAEDVTFDLYSTGLSYVRSFGLFGKSARIDTLIPYSSGRWEGFVDGEYRSLRKRGLMDPRVRFSINLYGAPALKGKEYQQYRAKSRVNTTIGAGLSLTVPLGDYTDETLINLSRNRWTIRPQLGVLHQRNKWQLELTGSVLLFGTNDDFWHGTVHKQDPIWFLQSHVIYSFKPGLWASLSGGFAHGGRSSVDEIPKTDDRRTAYMAISVGTAIGKTQGLKLAYVRNETHVPTGTDLHSFLLGWSYRWAN